MQRLEDGDAFDLQRELEIRLTEAKRKVKIHMSFLKAGAVLEVITVIFLLGFLGWTISYHVIVCNSRNRIGQIR